MDVRTPADAEASRVAELEALVKDLEASESRYRSVAVASPIGIYEMDAEPVLRFVNERWQEITGFPASEALGHNWQKLMHPDDRGSMAAQWLATGARGPYRARIVSSG